jgi:hypothetical protein
LLHLLRPHGRHTAFISVFSVNFMGYLNHVEP